MTALVEVVAAALSDAQGRILLTSRPPGKAYAGYWEFAGGKVEAEETLFEALAREWQEELGIRIYHARPWLVRIHHYEHAHVKLHFFRVPHDGWDGTPAAREGQGLRWEVPGQWQAQPMLPANVAILKALEVPPYLSGSLNRHGQGVWQGESSTGLWRVSADPCAAHEACLLTLAQWRAFAAAGHTATAQRWAWVESREALCAAADQDALVWPLQQAAQVPMLRQWLQEGLGQPLVVAVSGADSALLQAALALMEAGAHAVAVVESASLFPTA